MMELGVTKSQRSKEESSDYRYFPEPDLPPVVTTEQDINDQKMKLGRLPTELRGLLVRTNISYHPMIHVC